MKTVFLVFILLVSCPLVLLSETVDSQAGLDANPVSLQNVPQDVVITTGTNAGKEDSLVSSSQPKESDDFEDARKDLYQPGAVLENEGIDFWHPDNNVHQESASAPDQGSANEENIQKQLMHTLQEMTFDKKESSSTHVDQWGETENTVLYLSLGDVIKAVVSSNPDVRGTRLEWLASCRKLRSSYGVFEPTLVGSYEINASTRENTALEMLQQGGNPVFTEDNKIYNAAVEGKLPIGTNYNVGCTLTEGKNNLTILDQFVSFAGVTVTQPLLKGAWYGTPLADIKVSKIDRSIAFHNLRTKLMKAIFEGETAYWNLSFCEEKKGAAAASVEIARKLVKDSEERVKTGKMSPLDLLEAEAGLAARLANQADTQQDFLDAMSRLKLLLSSDQISEDCWIRATTPMTAPYEKIDETIKDDQVIREILRYQPEYLVKRYAVDREKVAVDVQKNQTLPEVNLKGNYGYNGLGMKLGLRLRK
jgi:hypothetical protein